MSDFLAYFGNEKHGDELLNYLKIFCGSKEQSGKSWNFPWGCAAILSDPNVKGNNWVEPKAKSEITVLAWIGDLITQCDDRMARNIDQLLAEIQNNVSRQKIDSDIHETFKDLNGAFSIFHASAIGICAITDLLGSTSVYTGLSNEMSVRVLGTHADLVAQINNNTLSVDPVSVFEFLNRGSPCFPYSLHKNVVELEPGSFHIINGAGINRSKIASIPYWTFPEEYEDIPEEGDIINALIKGFKTGVHARCKDGKVIVPISGGMDSRLIMAAIPKDVECVGVTYCDTINREARIAREVSKCYRREWLPLFRKPDYLADTLERSIRFIGCEWDWVHAHGIGFSDEINEIGGSAVLYGLYMNAIMRGVFSRDLKRISRWWGMLPPRYERKPYNYSNDLTPFKEALFNDEVTTISRERRDSFQRWHPTRTREMKAEWLTAYPLSQTCYSLWPAERRMMPVKLAVLDRSIIELACRLPLLEKLKNRIFLGVANNILGKGMHIVYANSGTKPSSGRPSFLFQRLTRKGTDLCRKALTGVGVRERVQHSWHDYQTYFRESPKLAQLIRDYGKYLEDYEGSVFAEKPGRVLYDPQTHWKDGFRMVQLAVWTARLKEKLGQRSIRT